MVPQQAAHQGAVGNFSGDEAKPAARRSCEIVGGGRIGAFVNRDDISLRLFEPGLDEVGTDETGPSGNDNVRQRRSG
jgi:hypothetical protein